MPTAPDPAQRSRNRASLIRGARILNNVSRKRSEVGRVSSDGGLFNLRPRYLPAMIRMVTLDDPAAWGNGAVARPLGRAQCVGYKTTSLSEGRQPFRFS